MVLLLVVVFVGAEGLTVGMADVEADPKMSAKGSSSSDCFISFWFSSTTDLVPGTTPNTSSKGSNILPISEGFVGDTSNDESSSKENNVVVSLAVGVGIVVVTFFPSASFVPLSFPDVPAVVGVEDRKSSKSSIFRGESLLGIDTCYCYGKREHNQKKG